ncbi:prolyl oligopeptidase family serine peptidase [Amycolatopsis sp. NPDC005232]|uniref:alpha/beta hydrolase family protein n=1 Tax=Amycolatopsis sp. NPDC005232 TaxID=3157027 RepID=UPI0033B6ACF0
MGTTPEADPDSYRAASPRFRLPLGKPHLVVHGDADERVPVDHSRDYVAAARSAGDRVDYLELPDVGHFELIDPSHPSWIEARSWLQDNVCPK